MKKFYITLLLSMPFISMAQIIYGSKSFYENPETRFLVDTSMFLNGEFYSKEYYYKQNGSIEENYRNEYNVIGNKLDRYTNVFLNNPDYDFFEYRTLFESENPILYQFAYKVKDDPNLYGAELDSFVYEKGKIKYQYNFNYKAEFNYQLEFIHDSIYGLKKIQIKQNTSTSNIFGLFDVLEFHKPNLPKIMNSYYDLKGNFDLDMTSHFSYDSRDRLISLVDSINEQGKLIPYSTTKIVYLGNTNKIDSMYYDEVMFDYYSYTKHIYDEHGKVKTILTYLKGGDNNYTLNFRSEFFKGTTGLSKTASDEFKMKMYPNPTSDKIFIESKEKISEVKVFDTKGKLLLTKTENVISEINLDELPAGIYFIKAKSEKGFAHSRILKTN